MPQKDLVLLIPHLYTGTLIVGVGYLVFYLEFFSLKNYELFFFKFFKEYSIILIVLTMFKSNVYSKIPYNSVIK